VRAIHREEMDCTDFVLAEHLGMTLAEVGAMHPEEYEWWVAWLIVKRHHEQFAAERG